MLIPNKIYARKGLLFIILLSTAFFVIFAFLSIRRIHVLWASYFDLGIMHQTVYNTYASIKELDPTRFLELTDPHGSGKQINRMAIHADILLALLAPLYYIHNGPETLLIVQAFFVASGGVALYLIAKHAIERSQHTHFLVKYIPFIVPLLYFLYAPLHRALLYEFHAVTLAISLVLWLYFAYLHRKWIAVAILSTLLLISKEQIGFGLGMFFFIEAIRTTSLKKNILHHPAQIASLLVRNKKAKILLLCALGSIVYVLLAVFVFMPLFRMGNDHFALSYFEKQSSSSFIQSLFSHLAQLMSKPTLIYVLTLLAPLALTPLGSIMVLPALPDLLINILSSSENMRNIYFHYTSFITPWLFVGMVEVLGRLSTWKNKQFLSVTVTILVVCTLIFSYQSSPLPYSKSNQNSLWTGNPVEQQDILLWQQILESDAIKVSATGQFAPYLTGRRFYYDFGKNYKNADYVVLMINRKSGKVSSYGDEREMNIAYQELIRSTLFGKIYTRGSVEVYKKLP